MTLTPEQMKQLDPKIRAVAEQAILLIETSEQLAQARKERDVLKRALETISFNDKCDCELLSDTCSWHIANQALTSINKDS